MACKFKANTADTESILGNTLMQIANDEAQANTYLNHFRTPQFNEVFGDYKKAREDNYEDDTTQILDRVDENGEPKLFYNDTTKSYFYKDKNQKQITFPFQRQGLRGFLSSTEIAELSSTLGLQFYKATEAVEEGSVDSIKLVGFLNKYISDRLSDIYDNENASDHDYDRATTMERILEYTPELAKKVAERFKSINFELEDDFTNEDEEVRDYSFSKSSAETNRSLGIRQSIKLMISLLEDTRKKDFLFNEPQFLPFETVFGTLGYALSDQVAVTKFENGVRVSEDIFEIYKEKINELIAGGKKEFQVLLDKLEKLSEEEQNAFVKSFYMGNQDMITTTFEKDKKGNVSFVSKNLKRTNSVGQIIQHNWFEQFKENFLSENSLEFDKKKYPAANIKSIVESVHQTMANKDFTLETKTAYIREALNNIGILVSESGFNDFLKEGNRYASNDIVKSNLEATVQNIDMILEVENGKVDFKKLQAKLIEGYDFNTARFFRQLADSEGKYREDRADSTTKVGAKTMWNFSNLSALRAKILTFKKYPEMLVQHVTGTTGFHRFSMFANHLLDAKDSDFTKNQGSETSKTRLDNFGMATFLGIQTEDGVTETGSLALGDYLIDNYNKILKGEGVKTIAPADKGTDNQIKIDFKHPTDGGKAVIGDIKAGGFKLSNYTVNIFRTYFNSELVRMNEARKQLLTALANYNPEKGLENLNEMVVHYHIKKGKFQELQDDFNKTGVLNPKFLGNAFKSQIFPELSPGTDLSKSLTLFDDELKTTIIPLNEVGEPANEFWADPTFNHGHKEVSDYMRAELEKLIDGQYASLLKNGVLELNENGVVENRFIDSGIYQSYKDKMSKRVGTEDEQFLNDQVAKSIASDLFINGVIHNIEYAKMFTGDPAFYKDMVDFKKRVPATYTDGLQLRLKPGQETFKIAVTESVEISSPYLEKIKDLYDTEKDKAAAEKTYGKGNINAADAQAWITPQRWKFLINGVGNWTDVHESLYKKMISKEPQDYTYAELKIAASPVKGVYFEINNGVPTYLKYSQAVLSPNMVAGNKGLETMLKKMQEQGVDELITLDGIKVGAKNPTRIHEEDGTIKDDFELNPIEILNSGWKMQQDLPVKTYKDTEVGSQIQKNIFGGIIPFLDDPTVKFDFRGREMTAAEIKTELVDVTRSMSDKGLANLYRKFQIQPDGTIQNTRGFYKSLIDELTKRGGNDNVIQALEKEVSLYGIPQAQSKIINTFASIFLNNVIKIKTNGGSFIQMSNTGVSKSEATNKGVIWNPKIENGETTYEPRRELVDGKMKVQPGGVLISGSFLAKYIPDYRKYTAEQLFGTEGQPGLIDSRILENVVGYRIPNQGLSSCLPIEIIGILPEENGDTIVAYTGITAQTGSDFDIDKMYIMFPTISKRYNKTSEIYNYINTKLEGSNKAETVKNYLDFLNKLNNVEDVEVDLESIKDQFDSLKTNDEKYAYFNQIRKQLTSTILDPINKNNEVVKDLVKSLDLKVIGLNYDNYSDANKLIELYKSILTQEKVIQSVMKTIDVDYFKTEINSILPEPKASTLSEFAPDNDIKLRFDFLKGKMGVAQVANEMVDVNRPGEMNIVDYMLRGAHIDDNGNVVLDKQYSNYIGKSKEDSIKILQEYARLIGKKTDEEIQEVVDELLTPALSDSVMAVLNGFVDIAKDPFITKGNWVTATTNTGSMMLRSGIHPLFVINFLAQPVLREYFELQSSKEGAFGNDKMSTKRAFIYKKFAEVNEGNIMEVGITNLPTAEVFKQVVYGEALNREDALKYTDEAGAKTKIAKLFKLNEKQNADEIEDLLNELRREIKEFYKESNMNFDNVSFLDLRKQHDPANTDMGFQMKVLEKFFELQTISKNLKRSTDLMKTDTKGFGKNINGIFRLQNLYRDLLSVEASGLSGSITGVSNRMTNSITSVYYKNGVEAVLPIVQNNPQMFPQATKSAQNIFNVISHAIYGESLQNEGLVDKLEDAFYSYTMAEFFKENTELNDPARVEMILKDVPPNLKKLQKQLKGKYLIVDQLQVINEKGTQKIILNNREKSKDFQNDLVDSWRDLFRDKPKLAHALVEYAYVTSSFKYKSGQFFTLIPHEYFVDKDVNSFVRKFTSTANNVEGLQHQAFVDKFLLNNTGDNYLVPRVFESDYQLGYLNETLENGDYKRTSDHIILTNGGKRKPFIKTSEKDIYKYLGENTKNGGGTYIYTKVPSKLRKFGEETISDYLSDLPNKIDIKTDKDIPMNDRLKNNIVQNDIYQSLEAIIDNSVPVPKIKIDEKPEFVEVKPTETVEQPIEEVTEEVVESTETIIQPQEVNQIDVDGYRYFGKYYNIQIIDGKATSVIGYKGAKKDMQKILDSYTENPNIDPQNGKNFRETVVTETIPATTPTSSFKPANQEQVDAITNLRNFIENGNPSESYTLIGKAGTGKTTIIQEVIAPYINSKRIIIGALSHQAKGVLGAKIDQRFPNNNITKASVASMLGIKYNEETGEFARDPYSKPAINGKDIVIIDECSMINEEMRELINELKKSSAKLIYLGDSGQLPPIRSEKNPYYKKYTKDQLNAISDTFITDNKSSLLERVRQGEESPILPFADRFWENAHKSNEEVKAFPVNKSEAEEVFQDKLTDKGNLLFVSQVYDVLDHTTEMFKEAVELNNPNLIKIVTYKNDSRDDYNNNIRESVFGVNADSYEKGDLIRFTSSYTVHLPYAEKESDNPVIQNSEEYQVEHVNVFTGGKYTEYEISFKDFEKKNPGIPSDTVLLAISPKDMRLHRSEVSALYNAARKLPKGVARNNAFAKARREENRYIPIDYNYAITSHKSQGSTYHTVIVDASDIYSVKPISAQNKARSTYTAITRASTTAILSMPFAFVKSNEDNLAKVMIVPERTVEMVDEVETTKGQLKEMLKDDFMAAILRNSHNIVSEEDIDNLTEEELSELIEKFCK